MSEPYSIVSVCPYKAYGVHREEGEFMAPVKEAGKRYARSLVPAGRMTRLDFGDANFHHLETPAKAIAEDLLRDCADHGLFTYKGDREPTENELQDAEAKQREVYLMWIEAADAIYEKTHDAKQVGLHPRVAAKSIGVQRAWVSNLESLGPCRFCKELVHLNIAKCPKCQGVLNWELAREAGMVTEEQIRFAIKKGWLPGDEEDEVEEVKVASIGGKKR